MDCFLVRRVPKIIQEELSNKRHLRSDSGGLGELTQTNSIPSVACGMWGQREQATPRLENAHFAPPLSPPSPNPFTVADPRQHRGGAREVLPAAPQAQDLNLAADGPAGRS
jgi:hypothetical protein